MTGFLSFPPHASASSTWTCHQLRSVPSVLTQLQLWSQGSQWFPPVYLVATCFPRRDRGQGWGPKKGSNVTTVKCGWDQNRAIHMALGGVWVPRTLSAAGGELRIRELRPGKGCLRVWDRGRESSQLLLLYGLPSYVSP